MGNCCMQGVASSTVWAGDDWGPIISEKPTEKESLLKCDNGKLSSVVESKEGQVRIRISKKQLEQLLRKVEKSKGLDNIKSKKGGQILRKIIDKCDHYEVHHVRQWKPALQSIPEVD